MKKASVRLCMLAFFSAEFFHYWLNVPLIIANNT